MTRYLAAAAAALILGASAASAQTPPPKADKMGQMDHAKEHAKMEQDMHHAMSPWKELDAFHMLVMATWHPAKDKNDLTATRAKSADLVASAKTLAASTAPKGCDAPKVKDAVKELPAEAQNVADLVTKKSDDATLKAALKALHDKFEVAEGGCMMPKEDKK